MAVGWSTSLLCLCFCILGQGIFGQESAFGMMTNAVGVVTYKKALLCDLDLALILYPRSLLEAYNLRHAGYTDRTGTACCFQRDTRNDCCMSYVQNPTRNTPDEICKCDLKITCGTT